MGDELFGDRLLVIDDEEAFGQAVRRVAESCGFEVIVTDDPAAFVSTARHWHPSVILLDLKMPGVDGIELLRSLAADRCAAQLVLSSGADSKILDSAMQLGRERGLDMLEAMPKPVRAATLRERLSSLKRTPKLQVTADLARAVKAGQLFLEYQPKRDCRSPRIIGVEALVRWRHPVHGIVSPDVFVPLAEEAGLIGVVTDWVFATAAAQAARWHAAHLPLDVAINISGRDIQGLDFPDRLEQICRDAGTDPATMTIELTETSAMREAVQAMDILTRLRLKGFKLSIDDFGTGYSSLVQLQKMPFSEIKIDRSFVGDMTRNRGCRVIVEIIVDLARKLGLKSVAEGVEDAAALDSLVAIGCDVAQGYHICRPVAAERIHPFVAEQHAAASNTPVAARSESPLRAAARS